MFDTNRRPPDRTLLALVLGLSVFGLVMVYSSSFYIAVSEGNPQTYYLLRQLAWMLIGGVGLLVAQRIDYRVWRRVALPLLAFTVGLLILVVLLPDHISGSNGAKRWIRIGGFQFQPTELAKFALCVYLAAWLMTRGDKLKSMTAGLIPFGMVLGLFCGIMYLQSNVSSAFMLIIIATAIYFAAGANILHIIAGMIAAGTLGSLVIQTLGHAGTRLKVFNDPWAYPRDGGWQPVHSLYALASGNWFGRGLGQGRQKFLWLPYAHSDAIFSVIGEELGLIGTFVLVGAFLLLAYRGFRIAARSQDPFAALMAVGITSWVTFQAFLNMAVVSSLIPFTGQTLPFISYGGTSLAMCLFAMGVLLNISKHVDDQRPEPVVSPAVERPAARPPARRPISLVPNLAALVRRRNRGPRVSGAGSRFSFARADRRAEVAVSGRGWRKYSSTSKPAATRRTSGKRVSASQSGGTWRSR
ncbi:MAG: putative lipid II flippase FtsW [Chloroflexota bacterium]|nr:putative lipid II flippase FtsW [Chloroflexota bacterium]PLS79034.1 MAG: putative lipid II flippase FtsW [Chloroflexota bacterium]